MKNNEDIVPQIPNILQTFLWVGGKFAPHQPCKRLLFFRDFAEVCLRPLQMYHIET